MSSTTFQKIYNSKATWRIAFFACALGLWSLAAYVLFPYVIPGVWSTLAATGELLVSGEFYKQVFITGERVFIGFALAFICSLIIGISMGRLKKVEAFFEVYVVMGLSQPGLFIAMILLVMLGLSNSTAIVILAFLATPIMTVSIWQGTKRLDAEIDQMSQAFGYSKVARIRYVILPQLLTPIFSGVRQGIGMVWKYVIMVEMLGLSAGVGQRVNRNFQLFDLQGVISWTIGYLAVIMVIEYLVIRNIEKYFFAWSDRATKKVRKNSNKANSSGLGGVAELLEPIPSEPSAPNHAHEVSNHA